MKEWSKDCPMIYYVRGSEKVFKMLLGGEKNIKEWPKTCKMTYHMREKG